MPYEKPPCATRPVSLDVQYVSREEIERKEQQVVLPTVLTNLRRNRWWSKKDDFEHELQIVLVTASPENSENSPATLDEPSMSVNNGRIRT